MKDELIRWSEIEPLCILRLLVRKCWLIVMAGLIGAMGLSLVLTCLVSRTYSSTATFVVTPRSGNSSYYVNTSAASEVASIYSGLLQSNVMDRLIRESAGTPVSGSVSASQLGDTNLISVTATSQSPRDALVIIQTIIENHSKLSDYVSSAAVLSPLDTPSVSSIQTRTYNQPKLCAIAGVACGGAMAAALVWLSLSRNAIQTREGAKNNLDARVLVSVPHDKSASRSRKGGKRLAPSLNISSPAIGFPFVESIHRIAAKFEHEHAKGLTVFLFSSVSEAEGKSTLAANTALSLAKKENKVLFIDLDLRRPVQHRLLGLEVQEKQELASLLVAGASPEEILASAVSDPVSGLVTLLSSHSHTEMVELIASPTLAQVLTLAREQFDYVVIDSPPLGYFADSEMLSDLSDASVLVVRQDVVPAPEINDAIDALRAGKAEFLGCVLNDMRHLSRYVAGYGYGKYGKYGKYGYGYGHSQKKEGE